MQEFRDGCLVALTRYLLVIFGKEKLKAPLKNMLEIVQLGRRDNHALPDFY